MNTETNTIERPETKTPFTMVAKVRASMPVKNGSCPDGTPAETLRFAPVCGNAPFGKNGESEDNSFARWTPSGLIELQVNNPDIVGKIKNGMEFYVRFEEVV